MKMQIGMPNSKDSLCFSMTNLVDSSNNTTSEIQNNNPSGTFDYFIYKGLNYTNNNNTTNTQQHNKHTT